VSEHVLDRLGAYLDAELPSAEEAAVSGHLRECPQCARHLEELGAVDRLARTLAVEPGQGYFESLPGRVRDRLAPRPKRASGPPLWTLAAAAALLLAVLTPLTLRQIRPVAPAAEAPRPAPGPPQPTPATLSVARVPSEALPAKPIARAPEAKRASDAKVDKEVGALVMQPAPRTIPVPRPGTASGGAGQAGISAFVDPWDTLANARHAEEVAAARKRQAAEAAAEAQARSLELDGAVAGASSDERDTATPREEAPAAPARSNFAAPPAAKSASAPAGSIASGTEARYKALLVRRAGTADEARALREAWRALARDVAQDPAADEIRERAVEAAAETYRFTGDPRDLDELRRDAEAYLARADALRAERVRELLREFDR